MDVSKLKKYQAQVRLKKAGKKIMAINKISLAAGGAAAAANAP